MFLLYYSQDQGLLDDYAYIFKKSHKKVKHLRKPSLSDIELALIQYKSEDYVENIIIENYQGSLDVLATIALLSEVKVILVLLPYKPKGKILRCIDNRDSIEIKKLTETTKKGYVNKLLSERYPELKISREVLKVIKERIPPNALVINELMENVVCLKENGLLNNEVLLELVKGIGKEYNFFDFLGFYLDKQDNKWINFFNTQIVCADSLRKFSYSISYQLLQLKRYLSIRKIANDDSKIVSLMKIEKYMIYFYNDLFKRYDTSLEKWLDSFIKDLYSLHLNMIHSPLINVQLLKSFLLKKKKELC